MTKKQDEKEQNPTSEEGRHSGEKGSDWQEGEGARHSGETGSDWKVKNEDKKDKK